MFRLVIVDDETSTRRGLRDNIPWASYGVEFVGEADDGVPGYELVMRLQPDLLITDVKMRNMDGIEMTRKLRQELPDLKVIFISAYDDVDYLKSALKVSAIDYILKPVNLEELDAVLVKVVGLMRTQSEQSAYLTSLRGKLIQSIPLLRDRFLISLLRDEAAGGERREESLREQLRFLDIHLPPDRLYCALDVEIERGYSQEWEGGDAQGGMLRSFAIASLLTEIVQEKMPGYAVECSPGEFACLLALDADAEQDLLVLARRMQDALAEMVGVTAMIGVGSAVDALTHIHQSYQLAHYAASQHLFMERTRNLMIEGLATDREPTADALLDERLPFTLRRADQEKVLALAKSLLSKAYVDSNNPEYLRNIALHIFLSMERTLLGFQIEGARTTKLANDFWNGVFHAQSVGAFEALLCPYLREGCEQITGKRKRRSSGLVADIEAYIHQHYIEPIAIKDIAAALHFTSTHICIQFKHETGETINDRITRLRMDRAKALLAERSVKAYDVCYAVGYADPSYFGKLFKRMTGVTPAEYRDGAR